MFSVVYVLFAVCATGLAATTISPGCTHNGKTYKVGENFDPNPCQHCFCSPDGRTPCAIVDCFFTPCVDAVYDPTKCCPTCPNGENCKHKDGTVIKKGDVYRPDAHTVCKCPTGFMFGSPLAICAMQAIDPVHTQVVS